MSSDTYSAIVSSDCVFLSPPAVIVRGVVCQLSSYNGCARQTPLLPLVVGPFGPVHVLVGQLLIWSTVLPGSLKLACDGRPEMLVSNPVQHGRGLIGPKLLRAERSAMRLDRRSHGVGFSSRATYLARATPQMGVHVTPFASHASLPDQIEKFTANNTYNKGIFILNVSLFLQWAS